MGRHHSVIGSVRPTNIRRTTASSTDIQYEYVSTCDPSKFISTKDLSCDHARAVMKNQLFSISVRDEILNCFCGTYSSFGDVLPAGQKFSVAKLVLNNNSSSCTKGANIYVMYDRGLCLFVSLVKECN